jgi:hypothetical protein
MYGTLTAPVSFRPHRPAKDIHSAYVENAGTLALMRQILRGADRDLLEATHQTMGDPTGGAIKVSALLSSSQG